MNLLLVAPVLTALVGIAAGWFLPHLLSPRRATQLLTAAVVLTSAAIVAALAQVAMAGASESALRGRCRGLVPSLYHGQHGASPVVGRGRGDGPRRRPGGHGEALAPHPP